MHCEYFHLRKRLLLVIVNFRLFTLINLILRLIKTLYAFILLFIVMKFSLEAKGNNTN